MGWLHDNMGYVAFFSIAMIVLLIVLGIISGGLPAIVSSVKGGIGLG
jgi:hypothetical protein